MDQTVQAVTSWGDAIFLALAGALNSVLSFLPRLLGAAIILLVGWLVAKAVEGLVTRGLRVVRFNQVADRAELDQFLARAGIRMDPAAVVGKLAYWFLFLIFIGAAFNSFGLTQVNLIINQIIAYIPNVIVAVVVLLIGALLANFAAGLVRGASGSARVGDPGMLASVARVAVLVFAALIALDQLQIAPTIVTTLWTAAVGMIALAGALAFGLGGRDVAARMWEDWYTRRHLVANQASRLTEAARSQPPGPTPEEPGRTYSPEEPGRTFNPPPPDRRAA